MLQENDRPKLILLSAEVIQFGHMCGIFRTLNPQITITELILGHILRVSGGKYLKNIDN